MRGGSGLARNGRGATRSSSIARAPSSVTRLKLQGGVAAELAGREVARVEGLQRVADEHLRARVALDRAVDRVEQLAHRHGGRAAACWCGRRCRRR